MTSRAVVPLEPTEEMIQAAIKWRDRLQVIMDGDKAPPMTEQFADFYKAMISAAPTAAQAGDGQKSAMRSDGGHILAAPGAPQSNPLREFIASQQELPADDMALARSLSADAAQETPEKEGLFAIPIDILAGNVVTSLIKAKGLINLWDALIKKLVTMFHEDHNRELQAARSEVAQCDAKIAELESALKEARDDLIPPVPRTVVIDHLVQRAELAEAALAQAQAKIRELESNEREYERILGPRSYQEVADAIARVQERLVKAERWDITVETAAKLIKIPKPETPKDFLVAVDLLRERAETAESAIAAVKQNAARWNKCKGMRKGWWLAAMDEAGKKGGRSLDEQVDAALSSGEGS